MTPIARSGTPRPAPTEDDCRAIRNVIITEGVGGCFWGRPLRRSFAAVLTLPPRCSPSIARAALAPLLARYAPGDILLLVPQLRASTRRLGRILGLACAAAHGLDPHALLQTTSTVRALQPNAQQHDVCVLAALHGHDVTFLDASAAPVRTFGCADALDLVARNTCYTSPFTGQPISCRELLSVLVLWKQVVHSNHQIGACMGMALWKRAQISMFLATPSGSPAFFYSVPHAVRHCLRQRRKNMAIWATRMPPEAEARIRQAGLSLLRVEDGFIRSLGLGSALNLPFSIFLDSRGIYYDPATESDLEHILATYRFDAPIRERADRLVARLHASGISKYDRGRKLTCHEHTPPTTRPRSKKLVILVPGQVADDLSVLRGGGKIRDNLSLLHAVRAANPDAHIIYRPHPDVDGGYRKGAIPDTVVLTLADEINRGDAITTLLARVDEVHTLTSLAGFEALIRNIPVTTYGAPFYAGWGLTQDKGTIPARRGRQLALNELVAGTLLLYPRYLDPVTRLPCPVETVLDSFDKPALWKPTVWTYLRQIQIRFFQMLRQGRAMATHLFHRVQNP